MRSLHVLLCVAASATVVAATVSSSQVPRDPTAAIAAQRDALQRLALLDGAWRGPASTTLPSGEKHSITQTERVGPLLDGSVRVVEGHGYEADGTTGFNALAVLSYDLDKKSYMMRSYAQGRVGDFVVTPTPDGFTWEIPAGPMTIRYAATIKDGTWHEVGDRVAAGKEPVRFFEMTLMRVGNTEWPAGNPVGAK